MNPGSTDKAGDSDFDDLDAKIYEVFKEEGVIIPTTVENVRKAKARLKVKPITLPPHLRSAASVLHSICEAALQPSPITNTTASVESAIVKAEKGLESTHSKGIFYRRAAMDAYIVNALTDDKNLGRTKLEKITHIVEYHCEIDFERDPLRDAAGPVDYRSRRKVESLASKQAWYFAVDAKNRLGKKYEPGPKIAMAIPVAERMMGVKKQAVDALIAIMRPLDTKCCEIIATLYAAWNDLLLDGKSSTDDEILREARENWHPSKMTIPKKRWIGALDWMRGKHLVPRGRGKRVSLVK